MATILDKDFKKMQNNLSEHEQVIKVQLEKWIIDVKKKVELEHRLQQAFENSKSHTQSLGQM